MIRGVPSRLALTATLLLVTGCGLDLLSPETKAALVPPTADEDPLLPSLEVTGAGILRGRPSARARWVRGALMVATALLTASPGRGQADPDLVTTRGSRT